MEPQQRCQPRDNMLNDLSEQLNLSRDEGEKWIVNLVQETLVGADAKIDLEKVHFSPLLVLSPS
jgi:hypothetical protein